MKFQSEAVRIESLNERRISVCLEHTLLSLILNTILPFSTLRQPLSIHSLFSGPTLVISLPLALLSFQQPPVEISQSWMGPFIKASLLPNLVAPKYAFCGENSSGLKVFPWIIDCDESFPFASSFYVVRIYVSIY